MGNFGTDMLLLLALFAWPEQHSAAPLEYASTVTVRI